MSQTIQALSPAELAQAAASFDHHGPVYRDHSTQILRHMQNTCPFAHAPSHGGFWVATKADTCLEIARDAETFSSFPASVIPALEPTLMIPLNSNPPELYDYRAVLNPLFAPAKMKREAAAIRADADRLMDELVARGGGDVVMDMAQPLTGITTLRLLGIPTEEWKDYAYPLHELIYSSAPVSERLVSMKGMVDLMRAEIRRQQTAPKGGIIEYLLNVDMAGRKLRVDEVDSIVLIMLGGGLDTGQALIGTSTVYLGRNPAQRLDLVQHPDIMESAVEELLRVFPPTQGTGRCTTKDATVGGQALSPQDWVFISIAAANRDPAEFVDPDTINFRRENNRHFTFGIGPHRCVGSHLARLEINAGLSALLSKAPAYKLVEAGLDLAGDVGTVYGYNTVPITI